jgi:hypothetical protein
LVVVEVTPISERWTMQCGRSVGSDYSILVRSVKCLFKGFGLGFRVVYRVGYTQREEALPQMAE